MDFHSALSDYHIYQRRIERLHEKHLYTGGLATLQQSGVSLGSIRFNDKKVSKLIAKTVAKGEYRFQPGRVRQIKAAGKTREVFSLSLMDTIVHGAVTDLLQELMLPTLSDNLYSYRKGVSWWTPGSRLAAFVRTHRKSNPDPLSRGLYVLRRDIDSYTDSIPVDPGSQVWNMIRGLVEGMTPKPSINPADWSLLQDVVRPLTETSDGAPFLLFRGVPTGQPVSCLLFNLYLRDMDLQLDSVPGAFYARYCDDILFAHPDSGVIQEIDGLMDGILNHLKLRFNSSKSQNIYLNEAGRGSPEWPEATGNTGVQYVGLTVAADGTVSLSRNKARELLRDLERRAVRAARELRSQSPEAVGRSVCSVINRALDPHGDLFQQRSASVVRRGVTDRNQLEQLDYRIARIVLKAVTGDSTVRAFRRFSYKTIRQDWGLVSLLYSRNRWGRH